MNDTIHWYRFRGDKGVASLGSDIEGGEICLTSSVFWRVIPTWQQEIGNSGLRWNQNVAKTYLFWSSPEFGDKIPDCNRII